MTTAQRWLGWHPLLAGGLAAVVFAVALVWGWRAGGEERALGQRIYAGPTAGDEAPPADIAGVVSEATSGRLSVRTRDGTVDLRLAPDAVIQMLTPIAADEVTPGDWIIVGGVDENVNTYIITGVVALAPEEVAP